jgi:high-affinity nickel-transport protein
MLKEIGVLFGGGQGALSRRIAVLYALLIAFNVGAWVWAFAAFHRYPLLMGTSLLAWSLGLRHAVDADHIAAIDNVTRKLMQAGHRPVTVGLMFSLGHSTVVVLASVAIAAGALAIKDHLAAAREAGAIVGTLVSIVFLFAVAWMNLLVLRAVIDVFHRVRRGEPYVEEDLDMLLAGRGFLSRLFRPLFRLVSKSRHMYLLGFLFGLGFDTATEIGLLGISGAGTSSGLSIWTILVFPALFTAGMTLIDTTDSILMLGAYGWAFVKPVRKLYYNITITSIAVGVALIVGGIEGLGMLAQKMHFEGPVWMAVGRLNEDLGLLGYVIIGVFLLSWLCSVAIYRWKRFDELEGRSGQMR